jgi:hypothetical protein
VDAELNRGRRCGRVSCVDGEARLIVVIVDCGCKGGGNWREELGLVRSFRLWLWEMEELVGLTDLDGLFLEVRYDVLGATVGLTTGERE